MNTQLKSILARKLASKRKANGFTLIELMVVVAIVGTLSAVGLPDLTKAQNKGKDAAALATVTNAAKECALNLIIEAPDVATSAHGAAIATGKKFEGITGACTSEPRENTKNAYSVTCTYGSGKYVQSVARAFRTAVPDQGLDGNDDTKRREF